MIDREAIKARCEAADDGPWTAHPFHEVWSASNRLLVEDCYTDDNASFIAHARTDIPELVAEVERLWEEVDRRDYALYSAGVDLSDSDEGWANL